MNKINEMRTLTSFPLWFFKLKTHRKDGNYRPTTVNLDAKDVDLMQEKRPLTVLVSTTYSETDGM